MNNNGNDKRLIEDFLPIQAISAEASREKSVRKGHISTLHLWWARRPLVACRAAVYGALVPASRFIPENGPDNKKQSLGRANAAKFMKRLCRYPSDSKSVQKADIELAVKEAQRHILEAHAERLTEETGKKVTAEDIEEGRAPRPKVLDMFAGGGAIPLEALRLGCEAYALDLNPVAHIIELCTLVYPQKYGKPDPNARGMTGLPAPRRFWAYVIKCADGSFYIGQTENLLKRYNEHCEGKVDWTATHRPLELIHWEEHKTREDAVEREQWLKTGFGRKWLKREYDADRLAARQAGPKNAKGLPASLEGLAQPGEATWGGLANEVRYWGEWVLKKVKAEIGDLYPLIPDPEEPLQELTPDKQRALFKNPTGQQKLTFPGRYLTPVAYLWTRTVRCKNPSCGATVPLVRQTWLCKKSGGKRSAPRYTAVKIHPDRKNKDIRFQVVEATSEAALGFNPSAGSKGGDATCLLCGTVADSDYVKAEGCSKRFGHRLMAVVASRSKSNGKTYFSPTDLSLGALDESSLHERIEKAAAAFGITVPSEPLEPNPRSFDVQHFGFTHWRDILTPRQSLAMICFAGQVRKTHAQLTSTMGNADIATALTTCLSMALGRLADYCTSFCTWQPEFIKNTFNSAGMPMIMDFAEANPVVDTSGSWPSAIDYVASALAGFVTPDGPGIVGEGDVRDLLTS